MARTRRGGARLRAGAPRTRNASCCCCETCNDVRNYYLQFSELSVSVVFQNSAFCPAGDCTDLSGNYILTYLADPSSIDISSVLAFQDIVWAYEFPTPIGVTCVASITYTHIIGTIVCAAGNEVRLVLWTRTTGGIIQQWRRVTHLNDPDVDCTASGTIPEDSLSNFCIPDGDATHEFSV